MRVLRLCTMQVAPDRPDLAAEVLELSRALDRLGVVQVADRRRLPGLLASRRGPGVDLVHAHVRTSLAEVPAALRAARAYRLPLVLTVHPGSDELSRRRPVAGAGVADVVVVPTAALRDRLRADGVTTDVRVVPTPHLVQLDAAPNGTAGHPGAPGPRVVALAGLRDGGRLDVLLRAVAAVPEVSLVLGGDGPRWTALRRLAEHLGVAKRVELPGRIADQDLPALLAGADVLVVPPADDAAATLLAGMRAGVPVVAVDGAVAPGLPRHEQDGLRVPDGDAGALAGALARLLADPGLAARLGRAGRERAAGYGWDQVAAQLVPVYEQVLARAHGSV
jgi:glycosyltransferase involved in cell wall biosynthesis